MRRPPRGGGQRVSLTGELVVGADGRGSRVAKLAGVRSRKVRNDRIAYGAYFEGPRPRARQRRRLWMLDPDMAAAFPTDERPHVLRGDAGQEARGGVPGGSRARPRGGDPSDPRRAADRRESKMLGRPQGKLDMTNVANGPVAPGLALVGDAALAIDPLWGVGCGWAMQSAEWLADSVAPALSGSEPLARGLRRYSAVTARALRGHTLMINDYAGGRCMQPRRADAVLAATRDEGVARTMEAFGSAADRAGAHAAHGDAARGRGLTLRERRCNGAAVRRNARPARAGGSVVGAPQRQSARRARCRMSAPREIEVEAGGILAPASKPGRATHAEAVVFVHGNPGSSRDWTELVGGGGRARAGGRDRHARASAKRRCRPGSGPK